MMTVKACEDCLEFKNGKCHELWDKPITEVDECPLGIATEEAEKAHDKKVKVDHGAKDLTKGKRKAPERKPDEEKIHAINVLKTLLDGLEWTSDVTITNKSKLIEFNIGENHYKLDLIKTRKPKK